MKTDLEKFLTPKRLGAALWMIALWAGYDALHDLWEILHFDWYRVMQADMPDNLVCVRWIVSVTLRVFMVWAVIGVLCRRELYRRLLVGLAWFNALTIFLHHRYSSFIYISNYLDLNTEDFLKTVSVFGHPVYLGAVARMLDAWVSEFFLALITITFFMHPKVRELFR